MTFSDALEKLKAGSRVARSGWNGKGMWMWIALTLGSEITHAQARAGAARVLADEQSRDWGVGSAGAEQPSTLRIASHIDMRAADGSLVVGWLASQTDMLSEDWGVVA